MKRITWWGILALVLFGMVAMPATAGPGNEIFQALAGLQSADLQVQARAHARLVCLDRAAVPELIRLLGDESCPVRPELARVLGEIGAEVAIDPLILVMQHDLENWELYGGALDALGLFKNKKVIEALIKELGREFGKSSRHKEVCGTLEKIGPLAIPALIKALCEESGSIRSWAIKTLGNMKAKEALEPLVGLIKDPKGHDSWVALDAATALADLGDEGLEALRNLAGDESPVIRGNAIHGLACVWNSDFDMCRAFLDDYWSVCMAAFNASWQGERRSGCSSCDRFRTYEYQVNRLQVRTAMPIALDKAAGGEEPAKPIRIMIAVDGQGTVDHAWIMADDASAPARAALAAAKRFCFEPLVINGRALPVRTVMTFARSGMAGDHSLRADFEDPAKNQITSFAYCPVMIKPIRLGFPEIHQKMRKKRLQGTVILEGETDIYGRIRSCMELAGAHPALVRLARAAMLKWIYEPYILSGVPKTHLIQGIFHFLSNGIVAVKEQVIR